MRLATTFYIGVLSLAAAGAAPALAQGSASGQPITLACGGVGGDESQRMLGLQKAHALTIIFSTRGGAYVSNVNTRIEDPLKDLQVEQRCGPIGLVDVPASGRYRIVAEYAGHAVEQWMELKPQGGARTVLQWPD